MNCFSCVPTGAARGAQSFPILHILWFCVILEKKVLTLTFEPFIAKSLLTNSSQNYEQDYAM